MSLSVLGDTLEALGRTLEAIPNDKEAVRLLLPYFLSYPVAFAGQIVAYARDYIRRCELTGQEPDGALLPQVTEALKHGFISER